MSDNNSESDSDMPKMRTVKPNPYASKWPFDPLPIPRSKVETRDNSNEPSGDQEPEADRTRGAHSRGGRVDAGADAVAGAGISTDAVQGAGPGGFIPDDINRSSIDKSSEDQGVDNPTPNSVPPAANRGGGARGGRGRGGAGAPAGCNGPAHRARVMGGAGA